MFWNREKKEEEKTIEEKIAEYSYEKAERAFRLSPGEVISPEELQARHAHWKDNTKGADDHQWQLTKHAYNLLLTPISQAAWEQIPPSSITLKQALKIFGKERDCEVSSSDVPDQESLNFDFGSLSRWAVATPEKALELDSAYRKLYEYSYPRQYARPEPMEPPCSLKFQKISTQERAAGWETLQNLNDKITDKEAHAVFAIADVGKFLPDEITALFEDLQTRCTTVEDAQKLDEAYRWLFTVSCRFEKDFTVPIASPYAPVLAQQLAKPAMPPVIEEEQAAILQQIRRRVLRPKSFEK